MKRTGHHAKGYIAMALIIVLMIISFGNYVYSSSQARNTSSAKFDTTRYTNDSVEILEKANLQQPEQPETGYEKQPYSLNVPCHFKEVPGVCSHFQWGWELFDRSPSELSEDLAMAAISLIQIEYAMGGRLTSDDIRAVRRSLGFKKTEIYNNTSDMNVDKPVTIISCAKADFPEKERCIICVDIRGTSSAGDFLTDVRASYKYFSDAAQNVSSNIIQYTEKYCSDASPEDISFFVIGHSLGGACAGLQAELLDKAGYRSDNTFIYTFASPKYRLNGGRNAYTNVLNFIITKDYIPRVPLIGGRYGTDIRYDDPFPEVYPGEELMIMLNAQPQDDLMDILWRHHASANYLLEIGAGNYSGKSGWTEALYYGIWFVMQAMQVAIG